MKRRREKKEIGVFYIYYRGRGRAVGEVVGVRWGTVRGRGYGRKERVWETLVGGVKEDTWACVRMGSGGGGSIVRTTAGTRKKKVEKMRRGDGCGRWVGVRVEGELRRFPEGDLLW